MSGGSKGSSSTTTQKSYTPAQEEWQKTGLEMYGPLMGQGQAYPDFPTVAPMTDLQQQLVGQAGDFAGLFGPVTGADVPLYGQTGQALESLLTGQAGAQKISPEDMESYFKGSIRDPAMKEYQETVAPAVREAFAGPGFWGKARAKEQVEAAQDLGDWLGTQRSGLAWNVKQTNMALDEAKAARMQGAVPQAMSYSSQLLRENMARLTGGEELYNFASMPQQQQQAEINAAIQKFEAGNRLTDPEVMSIMLTLLGQQYSSGTTVSTGGSSGGLGTAIGAGIGLLIGASSGGGANAAMSAGSLGGQVGGYFG